MAFNPETTTQTTIYLSKEQKLFLQLEANFEEVSFSALLETTVQTHAESLISTLDEDKMVREYRR